METEEARQKYKAALAALPKQSYSIDEVIAVTAWSRNRVFRLMAEDRLRTFKHGGRRYVSAKALQECIAALEANSNSRPEPTAQHRKAGKNAAAARAQRFAARRK